MRVQSLQVADKTGKKFERRLQRATVFFIRQMLLLRAFILFLCLEDYF